MYKPLEKVLQYDASVGQVWAQQHYVSKMKSADWPTVWSRSLQRILYSAIISWHLQCPAVGLSNFNFIWHDKWHVILFHSSACTEQPNTASMKCLIQWQPLPQGDTLHVSWSCQLLRLSVSDMMMHTDLRCTSSLHTGLTGHDYLTTVMLSFPFVFSACIILISIPCIHNSVFNVGRTVPSPAPFFLLTVMIYEFT